MTRWKEWQKFFDEYVTVPILYVQKIDANNISLGGTKYPDLVLGMYMDLSIFTN